MIRLYHGGAHQTLIDEVEDESVDALVTDPPYGIGYKYGDTVERTATPKEYWEWFGPIYKEALKKVKPGGFVAVWQPTVYLMYLWKWFGKDVRLCIAPSDFPASTPKAAFTFSYTAVAAFYKRGGKRIRPNKFVNNWDCFPKSNVAREILHPSYHPCPRPLDEMKTVVSWFVKEGGLVLDPFMGSGTTGLACVVTGRDFIGIEKVKKYYDYAQVRITTGKKSRDGKTYPTLFKRGN